MDGAAQVSATRSISKVVDGVLVLDMPDRAFNGVALEVATRVEAHTARWGVSAPAALHLRWDSSTAARGMPKCVVTNPTHGVVPDGALSAFPTMPNGLSRIW
jgi:hypothetical protein